MRQKELDISWLHMVYFYEFCKGKTKVKSIPVFSFRSFLKLICDIKVKSEQLSIENLKTYLNVYIIRQITSFFICIKFNVYKFLLPCHISFASTSRLI